MKQNYLRRLLSVLAFTASLMIIWFIRKCNLNLFSPCSIQSYIYTKLFHWWPLVSYSPSHFYYYFIVRTPSHLSQINIKTRDLYHSYQVCGKIFVSHHFQDYFWQLHRRLSHKPGKLTAPLCYIPCLWVSWLIMKIQTTHILPFPDPFWASSNTLSYTEFILLVISFAQILRPFIKH
jgi:hypothetical protein